MSISGVPGTGSSLSVSLTTLNATTSNINQTNPFASLDLTSQQQISQIFQNAKSQGLSPSQVQSEINAVLTPAQQQQLQNQISQRHHHHHQQSSSSSSTDQSDQTDAFGIPTMSGSSNSTQTISDIAASFWAQSQQQNDT